MLPSLYMNHHISTNSESRGVNWSACKRFLCIILQAQSKKAARHLQLNESVAKSQGSVRIPILKTHKKLNVLCLDILFISVGSFNVNSIDILHIKWQTLIISIAIFKNRLFLFSLNSNIFMSVGDTDDGRE